MKEHTEYILSVTAVCENPKQAYMHGGFENAITKLIILALEEEGVEWITGTVTLEEARDRGDG